MHLIRRSILTARVALRSRAKTREQLLWRKQRLVQDPVNGPSFIPLPTGNPTDDKDLPFITLVP